MSNTNIEFESVYKQNYPKLYTLAFRMTGNREDSEDILQASFLSAYSAFDHFRGESSPYTWLYRIVLNAAKKYYQEARKLPVQKYAEEHHLTQEDVYHYINRHGRCNDPVLVKQVRETCLQMFMNCMPSKYRAVYTLRIILHFPVQAAAEILDISESAVKVNLHRAKKIIKNHMNGRCSLIKPGSACDCRSYAAYLVKSKKVDFLPKTETMRNKERNAAEEFDSELSEVLQIDDLYEGNLKPIDYHEFLSRVKQLKKEGSLKILKY